MLGEKPEALNTFNKADQDDGICVSHDE